jgi:alkanesulfonate monooxygenase SsuD/methylene tetrahydromethanopterin reductase-like flavin-dependent oxidoreductase (luciferase family)
MTRAPAIGVFLPTMAERGGVLADVVAAARHAEELGFESVWAVDQLVSGTGVPIIDSTVALAAAAGATTQLRVAYGVLIVPLRPVVWAAKQAASLQQLSGGRLLFGVGVGGDRHDQSWGAAGVPRSERGRRTDAALAVLPDLMAGKSVDLNGTCVQLAPGVEVPPIIVGGMSDAALKRAATYGDGWFTMPLPPAQLESTITRLREFAHERRRPIPAVVGSVLAAIDGDPELPDRHGLTRWMTDPDGMFGMPGGAVSDIVVTGAPSAIAERLDAWAALGAERVVVTLAAGGWHRQADLLAEAVDLLA